MSETVTGQFVLPAIFLNRLLLASISSFGHILIPDIKKVFKTAELIFTGKNNSSVLMKSERSAGLSLCYIVINNKLS